jgi:chromosome segregation ATPase
MKPPVLTKEQNTQRIAAEGTKAAKSKFEASRALIRERMKEMEVEIEKNGGVYPYAAGRISAAEVLRRSGKSEGYLRKSEPPELVDLRNEVDDWVERVTAAVAAGARVVRKNVTDRVRAAQDELELVKDNYHLAELELSDARAELRTANKTIEELRAENAALMKKLAGKTVVDLPRRK